MFKFKYSGLNRREEDSASFRCCEQWCRENLNGAFSITCSGILISSKYDAATYALGPWNVGSLQTLPQSYDLLIGVYVPFRKYTKHGDILKPPTEDIDLSSFPDGGSLFCEFERHLQRVAVGRFHMFESGIWFANKNDAVEWMKCSALVR